jgi:hypothetical protein
MKIALLTAVHYPLELVSQRFTGDVDWPGETYLLAM